MDDKALLVEQMQMLVDLCALQSSEIKKDMALSIMSMVLAQHKQQDLES
ncbi:hypothetical protein V8687_18205 [Shewanella baltica]